MSSIFDPEFKILDIRMGKSIKYLNKNRHLIDSRISDSDIMIVHDMGIDAVSYLKEKIHQYDTTRNKE